MMENLEKLLSEIKAIENDESSFNPFDANFGCLENTHSDIIAKLLEPEWGLWDSFVEIVKDVVDLTHISKKAQIIREKHKIDILIIDGKNAVIIENKIWAIDQPKQLVDYHKKMVEKDFKEENIKVIYLTPFGTCPSKDSKGNLDVRLISYQNHILCWLENWYKNNESKNEELKLFVKLYAEQIRNTINRNKYMETIFEKCFESPENAQAAIDIYKSISGRNFLEIEKFRNSFQEQIRSAVVNYKEPDGWFPQDGGWQLFVYDELGELTLTFEMYGSSIYAQVDGKVLPPEIKCNDLTDENLLHLLKENEEGVKAWVANFDGYF